MSRSSTVVDLLRHGEPLGGNRYRGQTDDPLSDRGWRQMRAATADHRPWDLILSSPLARCRVFAEELSARWRLPLEIDERWQEIGFGEWEGRSAAELLETDAERLSGFWDNPAAVTPPGGEALQAFEARVMAAWNRLICRHAGRHVLLVAHAGTIRMIVRQVLDIPLERLFHLSIEHAGLTRVRIEHDETDAFPMLVFHAGSL